MTLALEINDAGLLLAASRGFTQYSWAFVQQVLSQDPEFPIEVLFKTGDHRLSSPDHLETFRQLVTRSR